MSTIKDLFENEELMNNIVEDIDDLPEDTEVTYEVWALGYDSDEDCTDAEYLIGEFDNPDEAVACAEKITLLEISCQADAENGCEGIPEEVAYFTIEVETVIEDPDDEDGGTINIGSIYSRDLWIDGSPESENVIDSTVGLKSDDFDILEDGTLKVSCKLLKDFNKNDYVNFTFVDEVGSWPMSYKIVSKVIYEDGDYYHCELMI